MVIAGLMMAVPSPAEADGAAVRVRLVADMLLQKAREVESKGNAGAAASLKESAADLHRSVTLLQDLSRHMHDPPLRLRRDSDASLSSISSDSLNQDIAYRAPPSVSIQDLVRRLGRVDVLLTKKSDEMKQKGSEGAANALLQSALTIRQALQHIRERQQMTRTLVVTTRALREQLLEQCRVVLALEDVNEETSLDEELIQRTLDSTKEVMLLRDAIQSVMGHIPRAQALRTTLVAGLAAQEAATPLAYDNTTDVTQLSQKCETLLKRFEDFQLQHDREIREAQEKTAKVQSQRDSLEDSLRALEANSRDCQRELESLRSSHGKQLNAYEEIQKSLLTKEEEYLLLEKQASSWKNLLTEQQQALFDLQTQREQDLQTCECEIGLLHKQLEERESNLQSMRETLHAFEHQRKNIKDELEGMCCAKKIGELHHEINRLHASREVILAEREVASLASEESLQRLYLLQHELEPRLNDALRAKDATNSLLLEQTKSADDAFRKLKITEQALSECKIESSRQSTLLQDLQVECTQWKINLLSLVSTLGCSSSSLSQDQSMDAIVKALCDCCEQLSCELVEARKMFTDLHSRHDVESAQKKSAEEELQGMRSEKERLQAIIKDLTEQNCLLEARIEAADTATIAVNVHTKEIESLKEKLTGVEFEFERYRARSHTALKKMEKRSELLNNMRRENADLQQSSTALKLELNAAVAKEHMVACQLDETVETMLMSHEESTQKAHDMSVQLKRLKDEVTLAMESCEEHRLLCCSLESNVAKLQKEKEDLASAKHGLHEQTLALKETQIREMMQRLQNEREEVARLTAQVNTLNEIVVARTEAVSTLENQVQRLSEELDDAKKVSDSACDARTKQLQVQRENEVKITQLQVLVDHTKAELKSVQEELAETRLVQNTRRDLQAASEQTHEIATKETQFREELLAAEVENQEMTKRLVELEKVKVTLEQEVDKLRATVSSLETSNLSTPPNPQSVTGSAEVITMTRVRRANEAQRTVYSEKLNDVVSVGTDDNQIKAFKEESKNEVRTQQECLTDQVDKEFSNPLESKSSIPSGSSDGGRVKAPVEEPCESVMLQTGRVKERVEYEEDAERRKRNMITASYTQKTASVVRELHQNLDEYSSAFREACALREQEKNVMMERDDATHFDSEDSALHSHGENVIEHSRDPQEYEEYLTLKSGVIIKAGSTFTLPVYCDKMGWRVEWRFTIKEDGADVGYKLTIETSHNGVQQRELIVPLSRVKEMAGVYESPTVGSDSVAAALIFEWDNTFSWLNEKTLDYQVSVFEPMSEWKRKLRIQERQVHSQLTTAEERIQLLGVEKQRRELLLCALDRFEQCGKEKDECLALFERRKEELQKTRMELQSQMESTKHMLGFLVGELDELETCEESIMEAWEALQSEHEDVDMTLRISANSHLELLMDSLNAQKKQLMEQLSYVEKELQSVASQ